MAVQSGSAGRGFAAWSEEHVRTGIRVTPHRDIPPSHAVKGVRQMIESVVESIRVSLVTNQRVVILKELEGERYLPIWIGEFEAEAIAMELQGVEAARPLPYDLMKTMIGDLGGEVRRVLVTALRDDVFYATIVIEAAGRQVEVDCALLGRDRPRRAGESADLRG